MPNDEHVVLLKQGVAAWNAWREKNLDIRPDLREAGEAIAIALVRLVVASHSLYGDILGFAEQPWPDGAAFRLGESLVLLAEDRAATVDPVRGARGWRYITLQIADIDAVHAELTSKVPP